jgi:3-oxoacyl-[acyl-carrier protein] reductase
MTAVVPEPGTWDCFAPDVFAGQTVLVTGAGGGMGARIARAFHDLGASVVVTDVDEAAGARAAADIGDRAASHRLDVTKRSDVEKTFAMVDEQYGRIDHVVTCAAIITAHRTPQITDEEWHRVFDINLYGTFVVCQAALARMVAQRSGHIVCVASDAGKRGGGGLIADAAYAASKAGVLSLVKSLAREHAGSGVSINALTPGPTDTPMHARVSDELKARIAASLPVGRMGHVDDMASAVVFLCSPAARFIYGASLNVDGGAMFE